MSFHPKLSSKSWKLMSALRPMVVEARLASWMVLLCEANERFFIVSRGG